MVQRGSYVVEVQRTRTGERDGVSTRPYRFGEFDLLAVCMWASTGDWHSFLYVSAGSLLADDRDKKVIKTFQPIPNYENSGRRDANIACTDDVLASLRPLPSN